MRSNFKNTVLLAIILFSISSASFCAEVAPSSVQNQISKAIISFLISKDATYSGKKIDVTYKYADKTFKDLKYRKGKVTFAVAELYPDFKPLGSVIIPIQVIVDGEAKEKLFLRVNVSVFDKIVVATTRFKRGDAVTELTATMEVRDVSVLSPDVVRDFADVNGKEAKTFIPKGNAIYSYMIKEKPYVKKNEKVSILSSADNIFISAEGMAMQDGMLNEDVKVKNILSGKEIIGVVTGSGEVTVK
jgi:flagella basal body P-ring formation protein FlgA